MSPTATRKQHGYYEVHDYVDEGDLNIDWSRPPLIVPDYELGMKVPHPGSRTRIVLEGKSEYVERLYQAMGEELAVIQAEIEGT